MQSLISRLLVTLLLSVCSACIHADTPDDPLYPSQYALPLIGAPEIWDATTGSTNVIVAVLSTGIDRTHPDLAKNLWVNEAEYAGLTGVDDDGNGYIDDVHGWDFHDYDNDPMDNDDRGTHLAGIVGSKGNNAIGTVGVNWTARLMAVRIMGSSGGSTVDAIEGINYAVQNGASIILAPFNLSAFNQSLFAAVAAAEQAGILLVAEAGNNGRNLELFPVYPANFDLANIISVAATNAIDEVTSFSNFGETIDIAAPGYDILSTIGGGVIPVSAVLDPLRRISLVPQPLFGVQDRD